MTTKITDKQLSELSGWDVAKALGCHYSGDSNPIEHGGFFYDARDWESYDYASVVEFWEDPETKALVVQPGTIHKHKDMEPAFRCIGLPDKEKGNIHAQIEACRSFCGIEPDGTEYPYMKSFNLDHWPDEWRIWRSVRGWIEGLGK